MKLRVLDIIAGTSVDGPGLRTSIYFAGCNHHCPHCHNPQSWDSNSGKEMSIDEIVDIVKAEDFDVTFSGGDPLLQTERLLHLAHAIKKLGKTIWCYTGYTYEDILDSPTLSSILPYIDVLVDGRFINTLRDISLRFRGSSNQRLIDISKSTSSNIVLWED